MNSKCILSFAMAAVLCLGLSSCKEPVVVPDKVELGSTSISFDANGGQKTVSLSANAAWNVSKISGAWFRLTPMSGKGNAELVITANASQSESERSGSITFVSGTANAVLTLTQAAAEAPKDNNILDVNFTTGFNGFTVEDVKHPSEVKDIWTSSTSYGAVASGYVDPNAYETESWLVSPEIDLTGYPRACVNFSHAANKGTGALSDYLQFYVIDGATKIQLTIPNYSDGKSWTYVDSGDIDITRFCGKKIKIAFRYRSTPESSYNWEIKTLSIFRDMKDNGMQYMANVPAWLELPAITDKENFVVHTSLENNKYVRNFSFLNSPEDLVALWVAYPHCDYYRTNNTGRTDAWAFDPFVAKDKQPNLTKSGDFYANGYDRGHQLASADRYLSAYMNGQTFYYTNMAPMLSGAKFNSGIWGKVEDKVRDWSKGSAKTDTLYVVTGSVVKGSTKKVKDNDGDAVTVPVAYYKALLRYSTKDSANGKYIGCAFYIDHKDYTGVTDYKQFAISIDELESKVGVDFFPNLEKIVSKEDAAAVEAADPKQNDFWWKY